jgi:hypothetical protein
MTGIGGKKSSANKKEYKKLVLGRVHMITGERQAGDTQPPNRSFLYSFREFI